MHMTPTDLMYEKLGIDQETAALCEAVEKSLRGQFDNIDKTALYNQMKVLHAMQKNRVSAEHMSGSTGYGYNDSARDTLEQV